MPLIILLSAYNFVVNISIVPFFRNLYKIFALYTIYCAERRSTKQKALQNGE